MDDKTELAALMQRIAGSLEGIEKCTNDINDALQTMRNRAEAELKQRMAQLNAMTAAPKYIAGRWPRRDGDGFGSVRNNLSPAPSLEIDPQHGDGSGSSRSE